MKTQFAVLAVLSSIAGCGGSSSDPGFQPPLEASPQEVDDGETANALPLPTVEEEADLPPLSLRLKCGDGNVCTITLFQEMADGHLEMGGMIDPAGEPVILDGFEFAGELVVAAKAGQTVLFAVEGAPDAPMSSIETGAGLRMVVPVLYPPEGTAGEPTSTDWMGLKPGQFVEADLISAF